MKWISVKDRLPEIGDWVLVFTKVKDQSLIEIALLGMFEGFFNPQLGIGTMKNVTHWMPLPDGPDEDINEPITFRIGDGERPTRKPEPPNES